MNPLFSLNFFENDDPAKQVFGEEGMGDGSGEVHQEIFQGTEPTCAIRSQQIILRDYGVDLPQEYLKDLALQNGWYIDHQGTPMEAIGNILESQGVSVHQQANATVYDLMNELGQGRRVIVGVDAGELWAHRNGDVAEQQMEAFEDAINSQGSDHALIVAGIEVNPDDPNDIKVILTDPGTGDLRIEYPIDQFMDAWQDSNCYMVATDQPAPYQYDPENNQMVPSNFAVEEFLADNTFKLNDEEVIVPTETQYPIDEEEISMPENYTPYYDQGHLNSIPLDPSLLQWDFSLNNPGYLCDPLPELQALNTPLNLSWDNWTAAYDMAYADGSGIFNMQPFMTQIVVCVVPVPVVQEGGEVIPSDEIPITPPSIEIPGDDTDPWKPTELNAPAPDANDDEDDDLSFEL